MSCCIVSRDDNLLSDSYFVLLCSLVRDGVVKNKKLKPVFFFLNILINVESCNMKNRERIVRGLARFLFAQLLHLK